MESIFKITITGNPVTSPRQGLGKSIQIDCSRLADQDPRIFESDTTFVRSISVRSAPVFKNDDVNDATIAPERLMDIWRLVRMDAGGHNFFNLPEAGGSSLRHIDEILNCRKNQNLSRYSAGLLVPKNSGTAAAQLLHSFSFYDRRGYSPEDWLLPIKLLETCIITMTLCQGTEFDAVNTPPKLYVDSMPVPDVIIETVSRDEYRQPALYSWDEVLMTKLDDTIAPANVTRHDLWVTALNDGNSTTARKFAANDFTSIYYKVGSKVHLDTVTADDVIDHYNAKNVQVTEHLLAANSAGTNDRLPIDYTPRFNGKVTKKQFSGAPPKLKFTSTTPLDPSHFRLLQRFAQDVTGEQVIAAADKAKHPVAKNAHAMPKTASKTALPTDPKKKGQARNLPVVLVQPGGTKG